MACMLNAKADEPSEQIKKMQEEEAKTQNAISSLEKESVETKAAIKNLKEQQEQLKGTVSALQSESDSLSSEYDEYADQLDTLNEEIIETEKKLKDTSGQIVTINSELNDNIKARDDLYKKLKYQIKTSYETNMTGSLVVTLLSSKSIGDFLNRAEYVSAIVSYQQRLLKDYKETGENLQKKADELKEKEAELDSYQDSLDEKQGKIEGLAQTVQSKLVATNTSINNERSKLANYNSQLKDLDEKQKSLESQVASAQAKLAQQIAERQAAQEAAGKKENTGGVYGASDEELQWLAATIMAEAGGESYTGKLGVGTVIMNRVFSSNFPNSIKGVITQNMQFASYRSGKVEYYIEKGPTSSCVQAAQEVLGGARIGDYLFFMTKKWADKYRIADYTMVGNHAFFYKWVTTDKVAAGGDSSTVTNTNTGASKEDTTKDETSKEEESKDTTKDETTKEADTKEDANKDEISQADSSKEELPQADSFGGDETGENAGEGEPSYESEEGGH